MGVPARHILLALAALLLPGAFAGSAFAQCGACPPPPCVSCRAPDAAIPRVGPARGADVQIGGVAHASAQSFSVSVATAQGADIEVRTGGVSVAADASADMQASSDLFASASSAASASVGMGAETIVSARCLDARGRASAAAQTFPARRVDAAYAGELYRCAADGRLRAEIGGARLDCAPGQAVTYEAGALYCRAQAPRRPCDERTLLRRYGPGEKAVRLRAAAVNTVIR